MSPREPDGLTDLHSHLVPGVDDGARTLEDALEGIGRLWNAGVRAIVTTPHLEGSVTHRPGLLETRLEEMDGAFETLKLAAGEAFPELCLGRGQELMLDVPDPVIADPRIRLSETAFVLVEWPRLRVPPSTVEVLERLQRQGLRLVLAHPERYHGLDLESSLPGEWRRVGAFLQVNYGSLVGRYGELPRKRAWRLLEKGWVDLFSTDFHGRPHLRLYLESAREALKMVGGEDHFDLLARLNPARILSGEAPLPARPLTGLDKGLWAKVLSFFRSRERG